MSFILYGLIAVLFGLCLVLAWVVRVLDRKLLRVAEVVAQAGPALGRRIEEQSSWVAIPDRWVDFEEYSFPEEQ